MKAIVSIFVMAIMLMSSVAADIEIFQDKTMPVYCGPNNDLCPCGPNDIYCGPTFDVVFVIDSTGSMADEIRTVKTHLKNIISEVQTGTPRPRVRLGVVTYRDHSPEDREYVLRTHALSYNVDSVVNFIDGIVANGGGDYPEAVADGLDEAINMMSWDSQSRKIIFLVGDAAPHGEGANGDNFANGCPEGHTYKKAIKDAKNQDIVIYTVSGSGMDSVGIRIWKSLAYETGGDYEQLSYLRQDLDVYYAEQGIEEKYVEEARADADYDSKTNTILTNTLGVFAAGAMKTQAADAGVVYGEDPQPEPYVPPQENRTFSDFMRSVFAKIFRS